MAIERTYIDDENTETALFKLSEYLIKTAVSKYFTKVENKDGVISCYTADDFLMMTIEYPLNSAGVTVHTRNGTSFNIKTGISSFPHLSYGYRCNNDISFKIVSSSGSTNYPFALAVTKDESGNTVIIAEDNLRPSPSASSTPVYIINENSDAINPMRAVRYDMPDFVKTVLAPLVVAGSSGNYTPDVFLQLFGHNTEQGTLDIDGVKYFSNGLWCIKDE
ncbi:MAG: hypothetical protein K2I80_10405 [Ruminococcus sp.]|nr:hypothetical protein [Ruminococcus sp.]